MAPAGVWMFNVRRRVPVSIWIKPTASEPDRVGFWTGGQPDANRGWIPTWDYPNDFATSETRTTVPAGWDVIGKVFLQGIRHYLSKYRNQPVDSHDFCNAMTEGTGITDVLERLRRSVPGFDRLDEVWLVKTPAWETENVVWFGAVWPKSMIAYHGNFCSVALPIN